MKNIIFLAPPAAGKGTQANFLKQKYGIVSISAGDLLKGEVESGSDLGKSINAKMVNGELIGDSIVIDLLEKRLQNADVSRGFILDGYPKNIDQAYLLDALLKKIGKQLASVFYFSIDKDIAMKRAIGRITCSKCGEIYNYFFEDIRPKVDMSCDKCSASLYKRADDTEESFSLKFDDYIKRIEPVLDFYKNRKLLNYVDSSINQSVTHNQIVNIIELKG